MGSPITWLDLLPEISQLPPLPDFCHLVEWAVQLSDSIPLTQLSGRSTYLTWFSTTQISKFPKLPNFCYPIELAIQLPYPICHLKSLNCHNYPIFVTQFQLPDSICPLKSPNCQNYPIFVAQLSRPTNWNLQISNITQYLLPGLSRPSNYPTRFATWNLQIAKSPHLCHPVCVGDLITHPNLPTDTHCHKYPISVTQFEWAIQLPHPLLHLFRWQHNLLPWFTNISSEISTNQLLNLVLGIYHIYILLGGIILSPSSPFHIQYNFWIFHVPNNTFTAWYLL